MKDFIKIKVKHSMMRHDDEVAFQTNYFLKNKEFSH
jgi:hypothetical protein